MKGNLKVLESTQDNKNFQIGYILLKYPVYSGSAYTGPDPFGTGTKLVRMGFVFTRDLVDPVRIGSSIWYQSTYEGDPIWNSTVPVSHRSRVNSVDLYHSGSGPKRI